MLFDKFITAEGESFWQGIGVGIGVFASLISLVQDVNAVYNSQGTDAQKTAAYALMGAIFCLSVAMVLMAAATGGITAFILPIFITVAMNFMKMQILQIINLSIFNKKDNYYV